MYTSNSTYSRKNACLDTQINFCVSKEGRLFKIIWVYEIAWGKKKEIVWGDEEREVWDLEKDANEYDLENAFTKLALGNPKDFKELYYVLKEHDEVTFPCIEATLQKIKKIFDFDTIY